MSSETDPLLPKGNHAPEITGDGFSKSSKSQYRSEDEVAADDDDDDIANIRDDESIGQGVSPLRTLIALFFIVVGLAFIITLFIPGALDGPLGRSKPKPAISLEARVDKILDETPLIG